MKNTLKLITAFLIVLSCSRYIDNGDQFASQYFGIYTEVILFQVEHNLF